MTFYHDYYWHSADVNAFLPVLAEEPNLIGPRKGEDGQWYLAVRAVGERLPPEGCAVTAPVTAQTVLGVWA